jgi:hypothetical protein
VYFLGLPNSAAKWSSWAACALGGTLGYLVSPRIWLTLTGPFRWLSMLSATMAQESDYTADAQGDEGASWGIVQFSVSAWSTATGSNPSGDTANDPRLSPFRSGYASARYVNAALGESFTWTWKMAVPVLGFSAMRMMWTGGTSSTFASRAFFDTDTVASGAPVGMMTRLIEEGQREQGPTLGLTSFLVWRALTLPLALWSGMAAWRASKKRLS